MTNIEVAFHHLLRLSSLSSSSGTSRCSLGEWASSPILCRKYSSLSQLCVLFTQFLALTCSSSALSLALLSSVLLLAVLLSLLSLVSWLSWLSLLLLSVLSLEAAETSLLSLASALSVVVSLPSVDFSNRGCLVRIWTFLVWVGCLPLSSLFRSPGWPVTSVLVLSSPLPSLMTLGNTLTQLCCRV